MLPSAVHREAVGEAPWRPDSLPEDGSSGHSPLVCQFHSTSRFDKLDVEEVAR